MERVQLWEASKLIENVQEPLETKEGLSVTWLFTSNVSMSPCSQEGRVPFLVKDHTDNFAISKGLPGLASC